MYKYLHHYIVLLPMSISIAYGTGNIQQDGINSLNALKYKVTRQEEHIDGLTTIIEGLSASLNTLKFDQQKNASLEERVTQQDALIEKLTSIVNDIGANYVSKEELKSLLADFEKAKKKKPVKTEEKNIKGKENATLYSEGVRHFGKKRYDEARERFTITEKNRYKPAASNFYLGEIAYYTKRYEDAIYHFKKSAGLYDQASYIDTLLFHTAVSLERTGDKKQAKMFYENIIENYPSKNTAKLSKQRLKKL